MTSKRSISENWTEPMQGEAALHGIARLRVHGSEAAAFLQRQCMSDLRRLDSDGSAQWSGLLSAKGRVLHLFRILRRTADDYLLLAPGDDATALRAELGRYVLRSKLRLDPVEGPLRAALAESPPGPGWLPWDRGRWIDPDANDASGPVGDAAWQHLDTRRGVPRVDAALRDRFTPQMLSLQKLSAFSVSKGCYPGQEIVARTHFLGQQKRALEVIHGDAALAAGVEVLGGDRRMGEVVQVSRLEPSLGLAVLAGEALDGPLHLATGESVQVLPGEPRD